MLSWSSNYFLHGLRGRDLRKYILANKVAQEEEYSHINPVDFHRLNLCDPLKLVRCVERDDTDI